MENINLLEVKNLNVSFNTYAGEVQALRDISFSVKRGETLAIVGESGSGKSVTVQTIMKLIPMPPGVIKSGEILFDGEDIVKANDKLKKVDSGSLRRVLGRRWLYNFIFHKEFNAIFSSYFWFGVLSVIRK